MATRNSCAHRGVSLTVPENRIFRQREPLGGRASRPPAQQPGPPRCRDPEPATATGRTRKPHLSPARAPAGGRLARHTSDRLGRLREIANPPQELDDLVTVSRRTRALSATSAAFHGRASDTAKRAAFNTRSIWVKPDDWGKDGRRPKTWASCRAVSRRLRAHGYSEDHFGPRRTATAVAGEFVSKR